MTKKTWLPQIFATQQNSANGRFIAIKIYIKKGGKH